MQSLGSQRISSLARPNTQGDLVEKACRSRLASHSPSSWTPCVQVPLLCTFFSRSSYWECVQQQWSLATAHQQLATAAWAGKQRAWIGSPALLAQALCSTANCWLFDRATWVHYWFGANLLNAERILPVQGIEGRTKKQESGVLLLWLLWTIVKLLNNVVVSEAFLAGPSANSRGHTPSPSN